MCVSRISSFARFWRAVSTCASSFGRDKCANVAMMFAIAAIPVLGAVGGAVDYGVAVRARSNLQAVADEAALAAVSRSDITASASTVQVDATAFNQRLKAAVVTR